MVPENDPRQWPQKMTSEMISLNLIENHVMPYFSAHCATWCAASSSQWAICLLSLPWLPPVSFHGLENGPKKWPQKMTPENGPRKWPQKMAPENGPSIAPRKWS